MQIMAAPALVGVPSRSLVRAPLAVRPVGLAAGSVTLLLLLTSGRYGWHRDELYFRMLEPAWGYVDQPPLMPFLVRTISAVVADAPWAVRLPSTLAVAASVLIVALLTRELGGGRSAQAWAAWGVATAPATLVFGHLAVTAPVDLLVWLAVVLCAARALLRAQPAWWLLAGLVGGLGTWNKWLPAALAVAGLVGLLAVGPRRELRSPWLLGGAAVALAAAAPNLLHQATHGWPQLAMGAALGADHGDVVRPWAVPFLLVLLGPPLVPVWVAGWWALWHRPQWRPVRFLAVAGPVVVLLTVLGGAQPYYPTGLLVVLLAAGCVPLAELMARTRDVHRPVLVASLAANAVVAALVALPVLPLGVLARSPVPTLNAGAADQLGWPRYVDQVSAAHVALPPGDRRDAVVVAGTYGLAGAVDRFGDPALGPVVSPHNELGRHGPPAGEPRVAVLAGGPHEHVQDDFATCAVVGRLDNGLGVRTEEHGAPITVCRDPLVPWVELWEDLRYLG